MKRDERLRELIDIRVLLANERGYVPKPTEEYRRILQELIETRQFNQLLITRCAQFETFVDAMNQFLVATREDQTKVDACAEKIETLSAILWPENHKEKA